MLCLNQISLISINTFLDEWKILQKENLPAWDGDRINHYWRQIFDLKYNFNKPKYPNIQKMIKAVLSLAHGSSDIERNFSISARVLTGDKSRMTERTLRLLLHAA
ncbi:hypothetical protein ALC62_15431 [Cyphomyrmex costatus]|uniref:HAT C-terminal dimerisation domain-containing protein n=1 Tax=Cyphomyrmex costatus TaxID=456900 RepID=A0A151I777_9HYME|nr:hypothetical protein ALC62_15431 [Cyphomyrmex costatus]